MSNRKKSKKSTKPKRETESPGPNKFFQYFRIILGIVLVGLGLVLIFSIESYLPGALSILAGYILIAFAITPNVPKNSEEKVEHGRG